MVDAEQRPMVKFMLRYFPAADMEVHEGGVWLDTGTTALGRPASTDIIAAIEAMVAKYGEDSPEVADVIDHLAVAMLHAIGIHECGDGGPGRT